MEPTPEAVRPRAQKVARQILDQLLERPEFWSAVAERASDDDGEYLLELRERKEPCECACGGGGEHFDPEYNGMRSRDYLSDRWERHGHEVEGYDFRHSQACDRAKKTGAILVNLILHLRDGRDCLVFYEVALPGALAGKNTSTVAGEKEKQS